jgi:ParB-like chromosome segregation protein Spo0J
MPTQPQGSVGGSQGGRRAHDASQNASGGASQNRGKQPHNHQDIPALGQKLLDSLQLIQGDLIKEVNKNPGTERHIAILETTIRLARALFTEANRTQNPIEQRLSRIENALSSLAQGPKGQARVPTGPAQTWANVAAARAPRMAATPLAQRPAVRTRIAGSAGKTPEELLKSARTVIQGAYAVKLLRSGDVEVMVKDQADKDRALNQPVLEGIKILR